MESFFAKCRGLAVGIAIVVLASACAGGETTSPLYVDVPEAPAGQNGLTTSTASGANAALLRASNEPTPATSVAQERFDEAEAFYNEYLQLRANSIDRTDPIEVIDAVTTPAGRDEVVDALAYNDSLHRDERLSAVDALYLYSNVDTILQADDNTILVLDCTEQHELNVLEQHLIFWQTNETRIDISDGEMRVDSFTTTHNGYLEFDTPVGCAPIPFQERAEVTAAQVWTDLAAWSQNVDGRNDDNLTERIAGSLREVVLEASATTAAENFAFEHHVENSQFTAVGIDTQARLGALGAEAIVVQVESCHRFPDGRTGFDFAAQTQVQDLRPGAEQVLRFHVLMDPATGDERLDQVVGIELLGDRCAR